jgi:hypothetical protein
MITGLAILHSEMAEAEQLRLECSVKQDCFPLDRRWKSCTPTNPAVSILVEIDFEAKTWVEFFTRKDGTQTNASGNLISVTQYDITLDEKSYDGPVHVTKLRSRCRLQNSDYGRVATSAIGQLGGILAL